MCGADAIGLLPLLTRVRAGSVLDAAEIPLHPDADAVVLVAQLQARGGVVVEGAQLTRNASEVLETTFTSYKNKL